jgi:class 3 adenylate cyclase
MSEASTSPEELAREQERLETPRNEYYFRILISFAAIGTLIPHIQWNRLDIYSCFFAFWVIYPNLAYLLTKQFVHRLEIVSRTFAVFDAFFLGTLVHIIGFGLMPLLMFLTIILCQALITGGLRKSGEDAVAFIIGVLSAYIYHDTHYDWLGDTHGNLASLIGISFYFLIYSFFIYQKTNSIREKTEALEQEKQDLKMKSWNLSRYVSPQVWKMIFSGKSAKLETRRKQMTVFFSDIKGFSDASEQLDPDVLTSMLSQYLTEMSNIVHKFGGTIDKFIGDAVMVFFGDPTSQGQKKDALACVSMAIEMKRKMKDLQQQWASQGITMPLEIRMGINTGYCTVGNFGTQQRMDYTAVGTEVNLASRLESIAPPGEIIISPSTYTQVKDVIMCRDAGLVKLKGFAEPIQTYQVTDFRKNLGNNQTFFEHRSDGFSLYMDIEKIKEFDKEKVLKTLLNIATRLKKG